ncbi:DUF4149 domain-containing protein [Geotalea toluenoxydans]|uniref:DUF4149 domain-containing protein n=1 Tax=Geotalea toluenoxydans TaxID=421624 RepID=UPI0006D29191|nr:DUF4149 domain-containing protein [Geotalea toluenoxydans]
MQILAVIYRLAVALWLGGVGIFTFIVTPIVFKSFGRDMAGRIVGEVFPAYFRWGLVCGAVALASLLVLRGRNFVPSLLVIVAMLIMTSFSAFYIEPRLASLKKEIPSFETTAKDHPLRREFTRLHAVSAVSNLSVFGGGVLLVILL